MLVNIDNAPNDPDARDGTRIDLEFPEGLITEHALRFGVKISNNVAEYEVVLVGINLASFVGAKRLHIMSDSKLMVGQSTGEYEVKDETMKQYWEKVRRRMAGLDEVHFHQIPRAENEKADMLAKLASSIGKTSIYFH